MRHSPHVSEHQNLNRYASISVSELLHLIEQHPSLLRRPIIIDAKRMQIGFNEDEIRAFLPRSYRKQELKEARMRAGIS